MTESLGLTSESYTYDNLMAGDFPIIARGITLISGQNLSKGTLIGRITKSVGAATADESNTGDGVAGAVTGGSQIKIGVYTLTCIDASVSGSEVFSVIDPDGQQLEDLTVGVAYSNNHFGLTIADGDTDFVAGDKFTITVSAGSGKYTKALLASTDGSQQYENMCILAKDTDASSGDVVTTGWLTGEYNENQVTFGTGFTFANSKHELAKYGIHLKSATTVPS